jgi:glycosyltransferase involved in cell wall biosynthesis
MKPLVSIIIPCYNKAQFLGETLDSVVEQSYPNIEVVVVDDGSPDNTREVVESYKTKMPNLVYMRQTNQGPSAARNNGIRGSKGEYVMALDADDKLAPTYVEKCVDYLENHSECKLVYSRADMFGTQNGLWDLPEYSFQDLLWQNMIFCSAMYRREDFDSTSGYNEQLSQGLEDWDFWLSFLKPKDNVHRIDEVLFHWRTQPVSRTFDAEQHERELMRQIYHNHKELYEPYMKDIIFFKNMWENTAMQFANARKSKAYRLGKVLLKPLKYLFSKE